MIITRTPFRISFAGGGSDMPSFYREHGGCVVSTAINQYMYLSIHPYFDETQTLLKYSSSELVSSLEEIRHPIFRSVLQEKQVEGVEIVSTADIPAGTGLGSSSAFTVGLYHTLAAYQGKYCSKACLAEQACRTEIEVLKSPIGKQDQYAAAFGGLNFIRFHKNDTVTVEPILMKKDVYAELQENLLLFYTGDVRSANSILEEQNQNMARPDKAKSVGRLCELASEMKESLQEGDLDSFGRLLDAGWRIKQHLASGITNTAINSYYKTALEHGALGGKLLGAGGGGFLLFYCEKEKQEQVSSALNLKRLKIRFDQNGTSVIFIGEKYWE